MYPHDLLGYKESIDGRQQMRVAVCDDNKKDIEKFCEMIKSAAKELSLYIEINEYLGGEELIYSISEEKKLPDAVFLDINMPGINGIDTAQKLRDMDIYTPVVFLTVSEEHFFQAFDVRAFNYILKQKPEKRLKIVLKQLSERIEWENEDFIMLTVCGEQTIIPLKKIYYFESRDKIMQVHYKDKVLEFYSTLRKIEEELFGKGFIRVHRSFLVYRSAVVSYNRKEMLLKNGTKIPIGRSYYKGLEEAILK